MFLPGYPVDPDFIDTDRRCKLHPLLHSKEFSGYFLGLSDQPVQVFHNLFSLTLMAPEIDFP